MQSPIDTLIFYAILMLLLAFVMAVACENVEYPEDSSVVMPESSEDIYEKLESQLPPPIEESEGEVGNKV